MNNIYNFYYMPKSAQKLKKTQEGQMNENHKDTR